MYTLLIEFRSVLGPKFSGATSIPSLLRGAVPLSLFQGNVRTVQTA